MSGLTRYAVLLYEDERAWAGADEAAQGAYLAAHEAFDTYVSQHGTIVGGEALVGGAAATTLRHDGNRHALHDGPYAETAEQMGGFYVVDLPDLDAVVAACRLLPATYVIEVRPVADMSAFG